MFFLNMRFWHLWIGLPDIRLIFGLKGYCFEIEQAIDATNLFPFSLLGSGSQFLKHDP